MGLGTEGLTSHERRRLEHDTRESVAWARLSVVVVYLIAMCFIIGVVLGSVVQGG